jgi:hypothetical protein
MFWTILSADYTACNYMINISRYRYSLVPCEQAIKSKERQMGNVTNTLLFPTLKGSVS